MQAHLRILDHRPHGYVAFDARSRVFEVAFLTTVLRLYEDELRTLAGILSDRSAHHRGQVCPHAKLFFFDNGNAAIRLALCLDEMDLLLEMVDEALMTRAVDEVMEDL